MPEFPTRQELNKYINIEWIEDDSGWGYRTARKVQIKDHEGNLLWQDEQWPGEPEDNCWGRDLDGVLLMGEITIFYAMKAWWKEHMNG